MYDLADTRAENTNLYSFYFNLKPKRILIMMSTLKTTFLAMLLAAITTSCLPMPTEDDYSLIPSTNNRQLTGEKGQIMPGVGY